LFVPKKAGDLPGMDALRQHRDGVAAAYVKWVEKHVREHFNDQPFRIRQMERLGASYHAQAVELGATERMGLSDLALGFGVQWGRTMSGVNRSLGGTALLALPALVEPTVIGELATTNRTLDHMAKEDRGMPYRDVMANVFHGDLSHAHAFASLLDHYHQQLPAGKRIALAQVGTPGFWKVAGDIAWNKLTLSWFRSAFQGTNWVGQKTLPPLFKATLAIRHAVEWGRVPVTREGAKLAGQKTWQAAKRGWQAVSQWAKTWKQGRPKGGK